MDDFTFNAILFLIFSIIFNLIYNYNNNELESKYIKAIKQAWEKYPILDLSLTKKDGYEKIILLNSEGINICDCSFVEDYQRIFWDSCNEYKFSKGCIEYLPNKASKILGIELYAKYYKVDYFTLFSRLTDYKNICKDGYKRCGYLDDSGNTLCVEEEENCPINFLHFYFTKNKTKITEITTDNKRKDLPVINTFLISDKKEATFFDINLVVIYRAIENIDTSIDRKGIFKLLPFNGNFPEINKTNFFIDNKLIKGELKSLKYTSPLYLYALIYPGNNINYPINMVDIYLIYYNNFLKLLLLIIRFCSFGIIFVKKLNALRIVIIIFYILFLLLYFIFIKGKFKLSYILKYDSDDISLVEYISIIFDLFICLFLIIIIFNTKGKDEDENEDKYKYKYQYRYKKIY